MTPGSPSADRVRFGVFELDRRSGELRKAGVRITLQEQGLQVLTLLAGAARRPRHARRAPSAALAHRHLRRLRSRPERRHQSPARHARRLGGLAALHRNAPPARLSIRCAHRTGSTSLAGCRAGEPVRSRRGPADARPCADGPGASWRRSRWVSSQLSRGRLWQRRRPPAGRRAATQARVDHEARRQRGLAGLFS